MTTPGQSRIMDRWAEGILQTLVEIAPKIRENQHDYQLMADFMLSATMALNGFIAMGVSQDWATHMIGHEITALHGLTHGHTLAIVLPATLQVLHEEKEINFCSMVKESGELLPVREKNGLMKRFVIPKSSFVRLG